MDFLCCLFPPRCWGGPPGSQISWMYIFLRLLRFAATERAGWGHSIYWECPSAQHCLPWTHGLQPQSLWRPPEVALPLSSPGVSTPEGKKAQPALPPPGRRALETDWPGTLCMFLHFQSCLFNKPFGARILVCKTFSVRLGLKNAYALLNWNFQAICLWCELCLL